MASLEQNTLNGTIAKAVFERRSGVLPGFTKAELFRVSQSILPLYQQLITKEGFPVWSLNDGTTYKTLYEIVNRTSYDRNTVLQYLATLEELAREGVIDARHYSPGIPAKVGTTSSVKEGLLEMTGIGEATTAITGLTKLFIGAGLVYIVIKGISLIPKKRTRYA